MAFDRATTIKRSLKFALAAAVLTAIFTAFMPNSYQSVARILPGDTKSASSFGNIATAAAAFGLNVPGGDGTEASYADILQSRWLKERLLRTQFHFNVRSSRFGATREFQGDLYTFLKAKNVDQALSRLGPMISASRDAKTKILTVSVETISPDLSQQLCNSALALLEQFIHHAINTKGGSKAAFATARLKECREELAGVEQEFKAFLYGNRNYLASADPSVRLTGTRLEAEFKLRQQLVATLSLSREEALMEAKNDMPILNVLDAGNLPIDKSKPARVQMVIIVFLATAFVTAVWLNRGWLKESLFEAYGTGNSRLS